MRPFLLLIPGLLLPLCLSAQNLVPNPGFETYTTCPTASCQWYYASNWNSVNNFLGCDNGNSGSPDYFHTCGATFYNFPFTLNGELTPLGGNAVMGLGTWLSFRSNFREYLAVPLTTPLQAGITYTLTFSYTNGDFDPTVSYGGYGTQLGVHFSIGALAQTGANPILLTPTYESAGALFSTTWQTITYTFTPTANFTHLTIGNFRNDAGSVIQQFAAPATPGFSYAYYYFDNISVVPDAVLPLELLDWNAAQIKDSIRLRWSSSALESPVLFQVERSADGSDYQSVGEVSADQGDADFQLTDTYPLSGLSYYRLRYVLADGSEALSKVLSVQFDGDIRWQVGPNPLGQDRILTLQHNAVQPQSVQVLLRDIQGRTVYESRLQVEKESQLDLRALPPGLYLLEAEGSGSRLRESILIL